MRGAPTSGTPSSQAFKGVRSASARLELAPIAEYVGIMLRRLAILATFLLMACSDDDCAEDQDNCCRVCVNGKACGDSCIQASLTCRVGDGCACNQCE